MSEARVTAVVRQFQRQVMAQEAAQMAEMARRWIEVQNRLQVNIDKLAKEFAALRVRGERASEAALWRMERYQALLVQCRQEITRYAGYAEGRITQEQAAMIRLGQQQVLEALAELGVRGSFSLLPSAATQAMVGMTAAGSPLRDLLLKGWPDAVEGLTKALIEGTALGWNPRKTARAMRQGVDSGLERMLRIARTEQLRAYRTSTQESYRDSGVVAGYRRLCARQLRTCLACLVLDGKFYPLEEEFSDHVNGRCTLTPVLIGEEGQPLERATGREWLEGLSDDKQRQIMGEKRWQAWKAGQVGLDDLVEITRSEVWGDSPGLRPL